MTEDQVSSALDREFENEENPTIVEVLSCNWEAFEVFQRCQQTLCVGAGGAIWLGFSGREVESVMRVVNIPRVRRVEVFDGVTQMGAAWAAVQNEQAKR